MSSFRILASLSLTMTVLNASHSATSINDVTVSHLRCEDTDSPQLVETTAPRFSWRLESPTRGVEQTAYQLRIHKLDASGQPSGEVRETDFIETAQSQWVALAGFETLPKSRYRWQVRVRDNHDRDSGWSEPAEFSTGLLGGDWPADWISDGRTVAMEEDPPARYLRREFSLPAAPVSARLYLSAFGLAEPWINGNRVTEDYFCPVGPTTESATSTSATT